jgi:PAS domain-containing protein
VTEPSALIQPEIQSQLVSEALLGARVGLLVWDEARRYIAANQAACEILGTTLDELLGQIVGEHTEGGAAAAEAAVGKGFVTGEATVERFDGSGSIRVFYATFETTTAGMPFMATLLAPLPS